MVTSSNAPFAMSEVEAVLDRLAATEAGSATRAHEELRMMNEDVLTGELLGTVVDDKAIAGRASVTPDDRSTHPFSGR